MNCNDFEVLIRCPGGMFLQSQGTVSTFLLDAILAKSLHVRPAKLQNLEN